MPSSFRRLVLACVVLCSLVAVRPLAAQSPNGDELARQVFAVLEERCFHCHGPDEQEAQLRLDAGDAVRRGGVSGELVIPGNSSGSLLIERILGEDGNDRMPLEDDPLSAEEIDLIRRWIDEGAAWPDGLGAQDAAVRRHWAYGRPERPALPRVERPDWVRNPIDVFVMARLEAEGLEPSPEADRSRLLRRVYLDLLGIPPTVDQVRAFQDDDRPGAYERAVERLLSSPRYGERWARPWLDLARYADSNGYQADQFRSVWPYRDWVVRALNDDMPFDQFTIEQLAGDLLPNATLEQRVATGFHRLTTCNVEAGVDPEENRVEQIFDRVATTGTVWLGTTMECAQCHNHKYDPFTQRDFYQLFAYFNRTPMEVEGNGVTYNFVGPKMDLPLPAHEAVERERLQVLKRSRQQALDDRLALLREQLPAWEADVAEAAAVVWQVIGVRSFTSREGAEHTRLEDESILVGGPKPARDIYDVELETDGPVTAIRLETLTHPSLPGRGPGRHAVERPNFILNEFRVFEPVDGDWSAIPIRRVSADFSQPGWEIVGAIDGDPATGWGINPQFGRPHEATFVLERPVEGLLRVELVQQHGQGRTIGRLRLRGTASEVSALDFPADVVSVVAVPAAERSDEQHKQLEEAYFALDQQVTQLRQQLREANQALQAQQPPTTLIMVEMDEARATHVFRRGDFRDKGEEVDCDVPAVLPPLAGERQGNRLDLARWLVDPANPLVGRVTVNRAWAEMFGTGIVATAEDFGTQGERPSHPELLDWLAVEFVESGWSLKHIHRLIVTSATYRQSSRWTPDRARRDPYNRLLSRGPRMRLPAEVVRDNALAASGLLATAMEGPPVYPPQPSGIWRHVGRNAPKYDTDQDADRFRRGLYVVWRRSAPYPSFVNFDAPDRSSCVAERPRTNTPLQALTLLNDPAYVEMAYALAHRMLHDAGDVSDAERIRFGFQCCVSREPTEQETAILLEVLAEERARLAAAPELGRERRQAAPPWIPRHAELGAWFGVANLLLNLDETITKG